MQRQPTQPAKNLPQAIIDLAAMLKDPEWLKAHVQAAMDINGANKLTEEEMAEFSAAQKVIDEAGPIREQLESDVSALAESIKLHDAARAAVANREKQCDKRDSDNGLLQTSLNNRATLLNDQEKALKAREDSLAVARKQLNDFHLALDAREQAVTEREKTFRKASGMLVSAPAAG